MDIFSTVVSAVQLADRIAKFIKAVQKAPRTLKDLMSQVEGIEETLQKCESLLRHDHKAFEGLHPFFQVTRETLEQLDKQIAPFRGKLRDGKLSALSSLMLYQKEEVLSRISRELKQQDDKLFHVYSCASTIVLALPTP